MLIRGSSYCAIDRLDVLSPSPQKIDLGVLATDVRDVFVDWTRGCLDPKEHGSEPSVAVSWHRQGPGEDRQMERDSPSRSRKAKG